MKNRPTFKRIVGVTLKNRYNSEIIKGDIINEDTIDGRVYYVMQVNNRTIKCAKESYTITKKG